MREWGTIDKNGSTGFRRQCCSRLRCQGTPLSGANPDILEQLTMSLRAGALLATSLAAALYSHPTMLHGELVYDDGGTVSQNPVTQAEVGAC